MKRALPMLLFLFLFFLPAPAQGGGGPMDMTLMDRDAYALVTDNGILICSDERTQIECPGARYCDWAADRLYVLCADGDHTVVRSYDGQNRLRDTYSFGTIGKICGFAATEHMLAAAVFDEDMYEYYLYTLDLNTGEIYWREEFTDCVTLSGDSDRLLFHCFDGFADILAILYAEDDCAEIAMEYPKAGAPLPVPGQDACILLTETTAEYISWSGGDSTQRSQPIPGLDRLRNLADADENGLYLFDPDADGLLFYPYETWFNTEKTTLTLGFLGGSSDLYLDSVIEYFGKIYPEYSIEKKMYADADRMFPELMSAMSDVDVIFIPDYWYANTAPSGVYADLRSFACIREMEESVIYLDWPFGLGQSPDGALYLVPADGNGTTWAVNEDLLGRCGLDMPDEDWMWQDLLDLGRKAKESGEGVYVIDVYGTQCMIYQYAIEHVDPFTGTVRFDTDLFWELLSVYQALYEEGLVEDIDSYGRSIFQGGVHLLQDAGAEEYTYIFQPRMREGDAPVAGFSGHMMGVYSVSDSPEAAARFIAAYYDYPLHAQESGIACQAYYPPVFADPAVNMGSPALQKSGAADMDTMRIVHDHYSAVRPVGGIESVLGKTFSVLQQLRNGEITIDGAAAAIQREVDMRINE